MLELALPEKVIFIVVLAAYFAAAIVGVVQLRIGSEKVRRLLVPLIALGLTLETVILIFRAVEIKAFPLTDSFESMIVLTVVFGLIYLFFSIPIKKVWFGSAMSWLLFMVTLLSAIVASPAAAVNKAASTPWAIAHGVAMILSSVAIMLASASGVLYLFSDRSLKQKKVVKLLGRMPNIEQLNRMNEFGLKSCFVLLSLGMASGIGLAVTLSTDLQIRFSEWMIDAKLVLLVGVWLLLGIMLFLRHIGSLGTKLRMYTTIVAFCIILFAIVGTTVFCGTKHNFSEDVCESVEPVR